MSQGCCERHACRRTAKQDNYVGTKRAAGWKSYVQRGWKSRHFVCISLCVMRFLVFDVLLQKVNETQDQS